MNQLEQLVLAVKEEKLNKTQLEDYYTAISNLHVDIILARAKEEKLEALYMAGKGQEESVANRRVTFRATESGQRLIELKAQVEVTKTLLASIKSRIYSQL